MESRLLRLIEPKTQLDSRRKIFSNTSLLFLHRFRSGKWKECSVIR